MLVCTVVVVRIVSQPSGTVDGINLKHYHPGGTYDMATPLAEFLVLTGYARVEMRREQRSHRIRLTDRRRALR